MKILFAIVMTVALHGLPFTQPSDSHSYTPQTQEEMIQMLVKRCDTDTATIRKMLNIARHVQDIYGVPASVTMTIMLIESDGLQSEVCRVANNCMGLTRSFDWRGPVYCKKHREYDKLNNRYYEAEVCFRSYSSIEDSMYDFGIFVSNERRWWFADTDDCPGFDPECWFIALAGGENEPGYPSDYKEWKENCMRVLRAYNLRLADLQ